MQHQREVTAKTVEEAIELALKEMDVSREEVEVDILSRGRAGFLGIGAESARIRVRRIGASAEPPPAVSTPRQSYSSRMAPGAAPGAAVGMATRTDPATAQEALEVVKKLMATSGAKVNVSMRTEHDADSGGPIIDIEGEDSGLLIGRRGETLQATQFLVNLMVNRQAKEPVRVLLDVERYRERRQMALRDMALKVAVRVAETGRPISLEPMSAAERRIVHLALANHAQVVTQSVGVGMNRKVSVLPRRGNGAPRPDAPRPAPDDE